MEVSKSCRLCAQPAVPGSKIFGDPLDTAQNFHLSDLINKHFPVKVSDADNFPKTVCKACFDQCVEIHVFFERIQMAELKLTARIEEEKKKLSIEKISEKLNRLPNIRLQRIVKTQPPTTKTTTTTTTVKVISVTNITPPVVVTQKVEKRTKRSDEDEDYSPKKRRRRVKPQVKSEKVIDKGVVTMSANYVCQYCRNRFDTFDLLKTHLAESEKCKFASTTCSICNKIFNNRKTYYTHSLTHREKFVCDCGKSYVNKLGLENHKATHTERESFQRENVKQESDEWGYSSTSICNQDDLPRQPKETTLPTKPEIVKVSPQAKTNLQLRFVGPKMKQFFCKKCPQTFVTHENLKEHELVHQEIECGNCGERAANLKELKLHLKNVHPGSTNETATTRSPKTVTLQFSSF